jgi:hypothetical protein
MCYLSEVYERIEMFKNIRSNATDAGLSGCPSTQTSDSKQDLARAVILDDTGTTIGDIATRLGISQGSAHAVEHDILGYHKVCTR